MIMTKTKKKPNLDELKKSKEAEQIKDEIKLVSDEIQKVLSTKRDSGNAYGLQPYLVFNESGVLPSVRLLPMKNDKKE